MSNQIMVDFAQMEYVDHTMSTKDSREPLILILVHDSYEQDTICMGVKEQYLREWDSYIKKYPFEKAVYTMIMDHGSEISHRIMEGAHKGITINKKYYENVV